MKFLRVCLDLVYGPLPVRSLDTRIDLNLALCVSALGRKASSRKSIPPNVAAHRKKPRPFKLNQIP